MLHYVKGYPRKITVLNVKLNAMTFPKPSTDFMTFPDREHLILKFPDYSWFSMAVGTTLVSFSISVADHSEISSGPVLCAIACSIFLHYFLFFFDKCGCSLGSKKP